jgi:hypothetical protein
VVVLVDGQVEPREDAVDVLERLVALPRHHGRDDLGVEDRAAGRDATLVRLVMLPAILVLLGDRVWWRGSRVTRKPGS